MSEPKAILHGRDGSSQWSFELTETHLVHRWQKRNVSAERRIALCKLCPDLSVITGRAEYTSARILAGLALLGLCAVFYFSVVQDKMPLLAPFVAVFGVWVLVLGLKNLKVRTWTNIQKEDGTAFAHYVHDGCDDAERKAFEEAYRNLLKGGPGQSERAE